jgi:hypothetical protein
MFTFSEPNAQYGLDTLWCDCKQIRGISVSVPKFCTTVSLLYFSPQTTLTYQHSRFQLRIQNAENMGDFSTGHNDYSRTAAFCSWVEFCCARMAARRSRGRISLTLRGGIVYGSSGWTENGWISSLKIRSFLARSCKNQPQSIPVENLLHEEKGKPVMGR